MPREFRRALAYLLPYRRALTLVVVLSGLNTVLSLVQPYLSKVLVDRALIGRDLLALYWAVGLFAAASVSGFALTALIGLRYTRVSADVLFDMRLALYRHLLRLSPRFCARTPLGDILARSTTTWARFSASPRNRCFRGWELAGGGPFAALFNQPQSLVDSR